MKTLKLFLIIFFFSGNILFAQTFNENVDYIQELERYYNQNVLTYDRDYPLGNDEAWAGKKALTIESQETYRLIYTWFLNIPTNATIQSATLYVAGTAYSDAQFPIISIEYQIKGFPDNKFNSQPSEQWASITSSQVLRTEQVPKNGTFTGELPLDQTFLTYIQNSLSSGRLHISIRGTDEETFGTNRNTHYINYKYNNLVQEALGIVINYTVPPTSVDITAQNNFIYGTIKVGVNQPALERNSPYPFSANVGNTVNLEAQNQSYSSYERVWNNYAPNSPSDWWRNGAFFSNQTATNFTVSQNDDNATYQANLRKNYAIIRDDKTEAGTQTNQQSWYIVEQNSGQISAPSTKVINNVTYNFIGWKDNLSATNPRTITPTNNETYTALYKAPHLSNNAEAYSNNGQRKFVNLNGDLFNTYASMGYVWLEKSTDNGASWLLLNNGKPIGNGAGYHPTMDYNPSSDLLVIAYKGNSGNKYVVYHALLTRFDMGISSSLFIRNLLQVKILNI